MCLNVSNLSDTCILSVVSPVYRAERIIDELVKRIIDSVQTFTADFEIILVEDGSPDESWKKIEENCKRDSRVKGIKLSRNFGQHHAITAGLDQSKGDWIIVMDCDLQDQPEEIVKLYTEAMKGYDIVFASRIRRQDTFLKRLSSQVFYKMFSYLSGVKQDGTIANFGIYSRKVVNQLNGMRESMRAFSPMVRWVGFTKTSIAVEHGERPHGKSSYSFSKLLNLAFDISISYSDKPLKLAVKGGILVSCLAGLYLIYYLIAYYSGNIKVPGYTSLIVSIWFLSGVIISVLGIVGIYVGKTFESVKKRPIYIIDKTINYISVDG